MEKVPPRVSAGVRGGVLLPPTRLRDALLILLRPRRVHGFGRGRVRGAHGRGGARRERGIERRRGARSCHPTAAAGHRARHRAALDSRRASFVALSRLQPSRPRASVSLVADLEAAAARPKPPLRWGGVEDVEAEGAAALEAEEAEGTLRLPYKFAYARSDDLQIGDVPDLLAGYKSLLLRYEALARGVGAVLASSDSRDDAGVSNGGGGGDAAPAREQMIAVVSPLEGSKAAPPTWTGSLRSRTSRRPRRRRRRRAQGPVRAARGRGRRRGRFGVRLVHGPV